MAVSQFIETIGRLAFGGIGAGDEGPGRNSHDFGDEIGVGIRRKRAGDSEKSGESCGL